MSVPSCVNLAYLCQYPWSQKTPEKPVARVPACQLTYVAQGGLTASKQNTAVAFHCCVATSSVTCDGSDLASILKQIPKLARRADDIRGTTE